MYEPQGVNESALEAQIKYSPSAHGIVLFTAISADLHFLLNQTAVQLASGCHRFLLYRRHEVVSSF